MMNEIQNIAGNSLSRRIGIKIATGLSKALMRKTGSKRLAQLEAFIAFIQGKGSGSGWDIHSEVQVAASFIKREDAVIFDVGANRGEWTIQLWKLLKPSQQHFVLVEPSAYFHEQLRTIDVPKLRLVEAAIGSSLGRAKFYFPDVWSPVGSLYNRRDSYLSSYQFHEKEVEIETIDHLVEIFDIDLIDFLKLDIEGHELEALKGASAALNSRRIKALSFEFGSGNVNSRTFFHDFWDLFSEYGYKIHRICPGGKLFPIQGYYEDQEYFRGVTNYLAVLK